MFLERECILSGLLCCLLNPQVSVTVEYQAISSVVEAILLAVGAPGD